MVRSLVLALVGMLFPTSGFAADCAARLVPPAAVRGAPHAITAADLIELRDFGEADSTPMNRDLFSLSPDGRMAALIIRRASIADNAYCVGLLLVSLETGVVRLADMGGEVILGRHDFRQAEEPMGTIEIPAPRWSPDGQNLAYLRRDGGITQLWRVAAGGGPAVRVTKGALDVHGFRWARDGRTLLYSVRPGIAAARAAIEEEGRSGFLYDARFWPMSEAAPRPPRGIPYALRAIGLDGEGDREASGAERDRFADAPPAAVPRGTELFAETGDGWTAWSEAVVRGTIFGPERLIASRHGQRVVCPGAPCASRIIGLWQAGKGQFLFLRDWSGDDAGAIELFSWRPGRAPVSILHTRDSLMDCQRTGSDLVCARERSSAPRVLERIHLADGARTSLFDPNPEFSRVRLGAVTRLPVRASDGTGSFGDLVLPPGHRPGERHPLVIVQYQSRGFLRGGTGDDYPIFLLAEQGYAVLSYQRTAHFSNGAPWTKPSDLQRINTEGWRDRTRVFTALQAGVDAAIGLGVVDAKAIGITGMSDGASTAIWAILNDPRYRVAALSQCCEDPYPSFYGNGPAYRRDVEAWGYPAPDKDARGFWRFYSLAAHAERLDTPILMQLADHEYRFALQSVGAFQAAAKPVELYVYPDEYHNKWQPEHRAAIYRRAIAWFDFWLRGDDAPALATPEERSRWRALRTARASAGL